MFTKYVINFEADIKWILSKQSANDVAIRKDFEMHNDDQKE